VKAPQYSRRTRAPDTDAHPEYVPRPEREDARRKVRDELREREDGWDDGRFDAFRND